MSIFDAMEEGSVKDWVAGIPSNALIMGGLTTLLKGDPVSGMKAANANMLAQRYGHQPTDKEGEDGLWQQLAMAQARQRLAMQQQQMRMQRLAGQGPPTPEGDWSATPGPETFARTAEPSNVPGVLVEGGVPPPRPMTPPQGLRVDDLSGLEGRRLYDRKTGSVGEVRDGEFVVIRTERRGKTRSALRKMVEDE
jgi:hypothetical protein